MSHNWSGWPGAFCTKCGVEHAEENALGLDWCNHDEEGTVHWKTPEHEELVNLCDSNCAADGPIPEKTLARMKELNAKLCDWLDPVSPADTPKSPS